MPEEDAAAVRAMYAAFSELADDEGDNAIVARIRVEGRGGASGTAVAQRFFHVIEMRDGRIARMREFLDEPEALRATGTQT